ncbi:MAG: LysR family transcriptional regulator [Sneathiella sp.]|nr:LysR family transcriptional regulator [Sneathiella sp.]
MMKLRNFDLNLFVTFEVIYDSGNLTQAAQILNVTQPAVSNSLARLRDRIGDPLFIHAGKRMNPTATADELIGPVRHALELLQGSIERDVEFDPAQSTKIIRLSIGDVGETVLLPRFVEKIRKSAPHIKINVFQVERRSLAKQLAANEIDFAVDIPMPVEGQLRQISLMSDHQVCALSETHPLASKSAITLEEYLSSEHIHVSSRRKGSGVADIELNKLGVVRNNVVRLQHYLAAFALLEQTELLLTTPASLARPYRCKIFDLPFEAPNLDLQLYWHKSSERSSESNWIRHKLLEAAADLNLN